MLVTRLYANLFYGMGREEGVRKPNDFDKLSHKPLHFYPMWFLEWHSVLNLRTFQNKPFCSVLLEKLCLKHRKNIELWEISISREKKPAAPFCPSLLPRSCLWKAAQLQKFPAMVRTNTQNCLLSLKLMPLDFCCWSLPVRFKMV